MKEFIPRRSNTLSKRVILALFVVSVSAMFFSTVPNLPYRSVMQLLSLVILALAIAMLGRYEFQSYMYAIIENDRGGLDLTVTELKRRSRITVCRIKLDGIERVEDITPKSKKQLKELRKGRRSFNYCVDISPAHACLILTDECGEKLAISISYIPELFEILKTYAK